MDREARVGKPAHIRSGQENPVFKSASWDDDELGPSPHNTALLLFFLFFLLLLGPWQKMGITNDDGDDIIRSS